MRSDPRAPPTTGTDTDPTNSLIPSEASQEMGPGTVLKTKLSFVNGSSIEAFPNSPETVRGLTLGLLIVDEANYIEDERALYDAVVRI